MGHDQIIAIDKLKKDKSKASKLKEAQVKLLKLKRDAKQLSAKQKKCQDKKCPDTPKPAPKVKKGCQPESKKQCRAKYMKITQELKTKIAMAQEKKKQHETSLTKPNKEAAQKIGAEIVKLQAELKKNLILFRNCKDKKCPGAPKPAPKPKKECKPETRKQCRAKYEKLAETTKAKIAMNQESKKRHETDKVPNKEAAQKEGTVIVKLQAELKKYLIAFR